MKSPCMGCPRADACTMWRSCRRWCEWFRQRWQAMQRVARQRAAQIDYAREIARMNQWRSAK